ncbi:MAG: hypothetical protein RLZZ626_2 [Actinomycetota bacterium]|jgi:MFS family permease
MTKNQAVPSRRLAPFVLLELASLTSVASGSMVFILMPWIAIQLTHQASAAGLLITITSIPGLLLAPVVGSVIDKLGRRRSAQWSEFLTAIVNASITVAALAWTMNLPLLTAIAVIRSVVGWGGGSARKALIPDVAHAGHLSLERANSIHESIFAAGFALGPALGALCIKWFGIYNSFAVVAAVGAVSGILMLFIRVVEHHEPKDESDSGNFLKFAVQGFKILFETPSVLIVMITFLSLAVIYLPTEMVVLPTYYKSLGDPAGLGLLISVMAAASTVGSLLFEKLVKVLSFSKLLRIAVLGVGITMIPMSLLPAQWVMLGFGAILGFVWGPLGPLLNTVIQRKVPANKRGRVFSLEMVIWSGGPMISMSLVGWAVDTVGVHIVYPIIAVLVLVSGIFVASSRHLVELNVADYTDASEPL